MSRDLTATHQALQTVYLPSGDTNQHSKDGCLKPGSPQRDGMGREVGGGIGMGSTCKSMADSCQCMAKTTTIL